jgi:hypothetical protein
MTDTVTSQNTDLSSWDILYVYRICIWLRGTVISLVSCWISGCKCAVNVYGKVFIVEYFLCSYRTVPWWDKITVWYEDENFFENVYFFSFLYFFFFSFVCVGLPHMSVRVYIKRQTYFWVSVVDELMLGFLHGMIFQTEKTCQCFTKAKYGNAGAIN